MKIHDITMSISPSLPTYPGDPPVRIEPVSRIARGDSANVSCLTMSSHCGSHLDVARHFSDQGVSVDQLPLALLIGTALVVDLRGIAKIDGKVLARLPLAGVERLLLRTDNSNLWEQEGFYENYVYLTRDGAEYLLQTKVRLLGIDYLSIEQFDGDGEVHRLLLGSGAVILEGLNLDGIDAGKYELICLPLKVKGGDGAPVRAILLDRRKSAPTGV
jgi:arylformamidase